MWDAAGREGIILCGRQFMNSLADSSLEEIKAAIRETDWLRPHFDIGEKYVRTVSGRVNYTFTGLDRNIDSVKSKSRILLGWVDEAEPVTDDAWTKLIPTLREEDSELWVTWNPESKRSATHRRFREASPDPLTKIVEINWRDNPWFPAILERKRQADLRDRADQYDHIWEGGFKAVTEGAYFARHLTEAKAQGRIGFVPADPLMTIRLFADIGGTGAKADNFVFWAVQFVGLQVRVLDHYEVQGQDLAHHLNWLRSKGYSPDRAQIWLPHDGATQDRVYSVSYESAFEDAGYSVTVIPNQGKGAASNRVEAVRRLFPAIWFNAETTEDGREMLGSYQEKRHATTGAGLGPDHGPPSHSADAFGLMAVVHEEPEIERKKTQRHAVAGYGAWA
jgi:phage terminase large subunit